MAATCHQIALPDRTDLAAQSSVTKQAVIAARLAELLLRHTAAFLWRHAVAAATMAVWGSLPTAPLTAKMR